TGVQTCALPISSDRLGLVVFDAQNHRLGPVGIGSVPWATSTSMVQDGVDPTNFRSSKMLLDGNNLFVESISWINSGLSGGVDDVAWYDVTNPTAPVFKTRLNLFNLTSYASANGVFYLGQYNGLIFM